jgi:hypothetical protein
MSIEDALKLIAESKQFLEPYRVYGPMITEGISQLEKLERLVKEGAIVEAYKLICGMCEQITAYRSFVPELAARLDRIKEILKNNS